MDLAGFHGIEQLATDAAVATFVAGLSIRCFLAGGSVGVLIALGELGGDEFVEDLGGFAHAQCLWGFGPGLQGAAATTVGKCHDVARVLGLDGSMVDFIGVAFAAVE